MKKTLSKKQINDHYIFLLTDDTGIFQHSKYGVPDPRHGYTTDDNARALIMAVMLYERYGKKKYLNLIHRFSSFILNALNENGRFKNFMSYDRRWLEEEGSEDCYGRCLWALGYAFSNEHTPQGIRATLGYILKRALPNVTSINYLRSKAYSIIGMEYMGDMSLKKHIFNMAENLTGLYYENKSDDWKWFENSITYSNSVLPWSLFKAYKFTGNKKFLEVAEESLEFLESVTFKNGVFKPVGCDGWLTRGKKPAEFDEQPVEACETVLTYLEAYNLTGKSKYKQQAKRCHEWYEGANIKGISLVDRETGGCFDGITEKGFNWNKGSESIISYLISYMNV
ncbi:glycosyltransferase [Herbivorax sp. ANBcel31]|uniref:glycosyltransferase n=1 Tax=Herbivorax sp. ANBcel31 TaxID=3069754 RepID=UPI0027B48413|nr:glycosyltransferase [Herbivorax sp. ANBcel31]MDQ2087318.1 glycosyltransferase [Herbivorax sp. ANBcel31]